MATNLIPIAFKALTRDGWLLFVARFARLFAYGSLSVILVFYLVGLGLTEAESGLVLTLYGALGMLLEMGLLCVVKLLTECGKLTLQFGKSFHIFDVLCVRPKSVRFWFLFAWLPAQLWPLQFSRNPHPHNLRYPHLHTCTADAAMEIIPHLCVSQCLGEVVHDGPLVDIELAR
jgi:hypothetical protein